jgi:phage baseplate assembly protein W
MDYPLPSTDPLGTDIKLDDNGDLVVDTSGSLFTITDTDNMAQAVRVNLQTLPYTFLWDGDVGTELASYVDMPITSDIEKEIKDLVTEKLTQDDRIVGVSQVVIDDSQVDTIIIFIYAIVDGVGDVEIPVVIGGGI